ncbi:tyrosine-type recombinase/integrase [Sodalis praecaptivus]|uniref:tyrosine-type recombinase/integrase n=1 Tax=Sodalis praecaptivus TaxID=1239307 RepID=UPI0027F670EF|nr:integrase arm-type DNA-binding domain-containing protein [Sodalis praecaptivus]CAJ0997348.1 Prophage integrase IntA [Sodalis praecaptivus]
MGGELNKLSDKKLRNLLGVPRDKYEFFADGAGLSVRVSTVGGISWTFTYRNSGTIQRVTLGRYPDMSLKLARTKRDECRTWLAEGKDPRRQLKLTKKESLKPVTVRNAIEYWITNYAAGNLVGIDSRILQLKKHIYPYIGDMALSDCDTHYWLRCFDRMKKTVPVSAGKLLQICKQALKFCRVRRYAVSNVLDDLTIFDVGKKEEKRDRVLTDNEVGYLWKAINSTNVFLPYYSSWLLIVMTFGCRSAEARLSRWDEWDLTLWIWIVPKEHSKTDEPIIRPIPESVREYIKKLKSDNEKTGFLLGELKTNYAVSSWGCQIWKRLNHNKPWTPHDLRRTLATKLNDMGVAPHVVEQLLGHAMPGVMGIYNWSQYLPEKLDALNRWVDRLDELATQHGDVVLKPHRKGK